MVRGEPVCDDIATQETAKVVCRYACYTISFQNAKDKTESIALFPTKHQVRVFFSSQQGTPDIFLTEGNLATLEVKSQLTHTLAMSRTTLRWTT